MMTGNKIYFELKSSNTDFCMGTFGYLVEQSLVHNVGKRKNTNV